MATLESLIVKLDADSSEFRRHMKRASDDVHSFRQSVSDAGRIVRTVFGALGVHEVSQALWRLIKNGADAAEAMGDLAEATGVSVEALSRLHYAAKETTTPVDAVDKGLVRLSRSMSDATRGTGEAARMFRSLGVEVVDAQGNLRSVEDVFGDVAGAFASLADGAGKAAAAQVLFGRGGAELVPLLNLGRTGLQEMAERAERLGILLSKDVVDGAEDFNRQLQRLQMGAATFGARLASELAPALRELVESFYESAQGGQVMREALEGISTVLKGLVATVYLEVEGFKTLHQVVQGLDAAFSLLQKGELQKAKKVLEGTFEYLVYSGQKARDKLREMFSDMKSSADEVASAAGKGGVSLPGLQLGQRESSTEGQRALETLQRVLADYRQKARALASGEEGELAELRFRLDEGDLAQSFAAALGEGAQSRQSLVRLREDIESAAKAYVDLRQQTELLRDGEAATKRLAEEAARLDAAATQVGVDSERARTQQSLLNGELGKLVGTARAAGLETDVYAQKILASAAALDRARQAAEREQEVQRQAAEVRQATADYYESLLTPAQRYAAEVDNVNRLLAEEALSHEEASEALRAIEARYEETYSGMEVATRRVSEDVFGAFFDNISEGWRGTLEGMGSAFMRSVSRMLADAAAANLTGALFGGQTGAGLLSPILGGVLGPGKAAGGPVSAQRAYLVGERGPELFVPAVSGQIVPHHQVQSALTQASSPRVHVQLHVDESALHLTMSDWLQRELANRQAVR